MWQIFDTRKKVEYAMKVFFISLYEKVFNHQLRLFNGHFSLSRSDDSRSRRYARSRKSHNEYHS